MQRDTPPRVLGVDGARRGWVGVVWDGHGVTPLLDTTLAGLCERAGDVRVVAVDMPIGLETHEPRRCDTDARALAGPRRSSLFAAPALGALGCETYAEANAWSKATTGRGLSKQAWMLVPKIREVRGFVTRTTLPVYETFPELSFGAMHGGEPLADPKRTWNGLAARLAALRSVGVELPTDAGPAGAVDADDLVDAAALAWSAMRIHEGTAAHCPADLDPGVPSIWW